LAHKKKNEPVQPEEMVEPVQEQTEETGLKPFITVRAGLRFMLLLSIGLVALLWYSAPKDLSWKTQVWVTAIVLFSTWLVFAFAYSLMRWIRNR